MPPTTRARTAKANSSRDTVRDNLPESQPDDVIVDQIEIDTDSSASFDEEPPVYTIDLSLPPEQRYVAIAKDFKLVLDDLTQIFDDLLQSAKLPKGLFHFIARVVLRKLYSTEQTGELKGISDVTGVPMYLLVAYNVLLDLFMGCTSGGILVKELGKERRMMHFRTLDWGMPALRKAIVQLEFVEKAGEEVVARTITYVGFVGVLTGVRKGLSLSLNFRPYHNNDKSKLANFKFYGHLGLVLLGARPCIAAHLRDLIVPRMNTKPLKHQRRKEKVEGSVSTLIHPTEIFADIARDFPTVPTTAAYLTFCCGPHTMVLEKDRVTANMLFANTFITATNHDVSYQNPSSNGEAAHVAHAKNHHFGIGMKELVDESMDRKGCMVAKWEKHCRKNRRKGVGGETGNREGVMLEHLKGWLLEYPVKNDETHFVAIMDPSEGIFRWVRCFEEGAYESSSEEGG